MAISTTNSTAVQNVIFDHCSISWAGDEPVSLWNTRFGTSPPLKMNTLSNVTMQWSIISEGLKDRLVRADGTDVKSSFTMLVGQYVENVSLHHNLIAHAEARNPALLADVTAEFINNVVYNWGDNGMQISDLMM